MLRSSIDEQARRIDQLWVLLAACLVGFGLMFGQSAGGWIGTGIVWFCATAYACFKLIERAFGLRVSPEEEAAGIDWSGDVVIESAPADPIDEDLLRGLMLGDAGE